jgi:uncharacterized repeat protein (TIGR02543 family)
MKTWILKCLFILLLLSLMGCQKQKIEEIIVHFEVNGGQTLEDLVLILPIDPLSLPTPIKEGHTFLGWYLEETFITLLTIDMKISKNMTVYAKWNPNTYTVYFILDQEIFDEILVLYGNPIVLPQVPIKIGYIFIGWYLDQLLSMPYVFDTMPSHDVTLYAKFEHNIYYLDVDTQNGELDYRIGLHYQDQIPLLATPLKEGYTFIGWYLDFQWIQPMDLINMPNHDVSIYAKWEINTYTITFDTNGGSIIDPYTLEYQSIFEISEPIKKGHTFEGWFIDDKLLEPFSMDEYRMPSYDLILYAKWVINTYTITYYIVEYDQTMSLPLFPDEIITSVTLGNHYSAAITSTGRLFVWGDNTYGKLGCSQSGNPLYPIDITDRFNLIEDEKISFVALGWNHTAAITTLGRVFTWGYNRRGELGNGSNWTVFSTPTEITSNFNLFLNEKIVEISLGKQHSAALSSLGRVFTWGFNYYGQLGNGTNISRNVPEDITTLFNLDIGEIISHISLGSEHSAAISSKGRIFTWGRGYFGGVGDGTRSDRNIPTDITPLLNLNENEKVIDVKLSEFHNGLITSSFRIFFWAEYIFHPIDLTADINLNEDEYMIQFSLGNSMTFLFTSEHRVLSFEIYGRSLIDITPIIDLEENEKIDMISLGYSHQSMMTSLGKIYLWGTNLSGEIGNGTIEDQIEPIELKRYAFIQVFQVLIEYGSSIPNFQPSKEGYTLNAWYDDVTLLIIQVDSIMPDDDISLFGSWVENGS